MSQHFQEPFGPLLLKFCRPSPNFDGSCLKGPACLDPWIFHPGLPNWVLSYLQLATDAGNLIAMTDDEKKRLEELLQEVEMLHDDEEEQVRPLVAHSRDFKKSYTKWLGKFNLCFVSLWTWYHVDMFKLEH